MKRLCLIILTLSATICAGGKLSIVTTTTDLADFARQIGGDRVSVVSLSRGDQDPHAVEPRPSMVMKVKQADLLIRVGMDLDLWVEGLIDASRNRKVMQGAAGYLDASEAIEKLEVPEGTVDGSMGDIHVYGNPHYWTCPQNALLLVDRIAEKMCQVRDSDASYFTGNSAKYREDL
ncbi:MAG: zinc ABC transporter substrate-binding protein, partial [Chitinispirillaceae bacterium]|nr:zinc ABC transporter substrate-binding protein [Chitinispirillaceae bacterium]